MFMFHFHVTCKNYEQSLYFGHSSKYIFDQLKKVFSLGLSQRRDFFRFYLALIWLYIKNTIKNLQQLFFSSHTAQNTSKEKQEEVQQLSHAR